MRLMEATRGADKTPKNPQMFGNAGREYMERFAILFYLLQRKCAYKDRR
jgi:hypothetical protein